MTLKPFVRRVNFYETDMMGIVHHSNYIRWFEESRVDFMEQINFSYERAIAGGIDIVVLGVACEYKSMVRFGDTVEIYPSVAEMSPARMTVSYKVLDAATGELRTTGYSQHCFYDREKQHPVSLKRALPELYELLEKCKPEENGEMNANNTGDA